MSSRQRPDTISAAIADSGLIARGFVSLSLEERAGPLADRASLVLIGLVGRHGWGAFGKSTEARDGLPDPLDRWSRRVIDELAIQLGAIALYPFGGPPFWPFQRWAQRAEPLHPSPLGLLIHPEYGLWHSYRGALAFAEKSALPPVAAAPSPCDSCAERPCLNACPVSAFGESGYDVQACSDHLRTEPGRTCMTGGCLARAACPVGRDFAHRPDQASFGMKAFLAARD